MEPIICNLGVLIPEHGFMKRMEALCKKYGTLLVMDEVACGFGRTGRLFASEHFGVIPDILCLAKALTGGAAPMGACMTTQEIARSAINKGFEFYSTYGWHPLSVEVAIANLRYWIKNKNKILTQVGETSAYFSNRLGQMHFKTEAGIRVMGMAIGIDVEDEAYAERIKKKCGKAGLLLTTQEQTLVLFPALTIGESVAAQGLDILEEQL